MQISFIGFTLVTIMLSSISSFRFVAKHSVVRLNTIRAFSASIEDTVVSRCTANLTKLLKPVKVVVTSTNDDPNGSHVSWCSESLGSI